MILIRSAKSSDSSLILFLIRALGDFEKLAHEVVATEEDLNRTLFGPKPAAEVLIAELNSEPVGFALFFSSYSTFLAKPGIYLEDLFVVPHSRSKGVGRALLSAIASLAVERGCGRLEWSCLDWNKDALRFYRSLGAVPMSEWTVQRLTGEDLLRLASNRGT